jgi:hypothetical protein
MVTRKRVGAVVAALVMLGVGFGLGAHVQPMQTVERVKVVTVDDTASFNDGFLTGHDDCKAFK